MQWTWFPYDLIFKQPAGTSRGVLRTKRSYILKASQNGQDYYGECGHLQGLSPDKEDYSDILDAICNGQSLDLSEYPSIQFGVEMLERNIAQQNGPYYNSSWSRGEQDIPINGLIWMGDFDFMRAQIVQKMNDGWSCIKMKIGAIDHEQEMSLLRSIRREFSIDDIELRVDANGAYAPEDAYDILQVLHDLNIHSIEQPLAAGQWQEMAALAEKSDLPIALDEELIGLVGEEKEQCLETIKPEFIILKPSLLGGWSASDEWISLAESRKIGWWATSALESNIGLNAIAQWISAKNTAMPQGLGTGQLYVNNIPSPVTLKPGYIYYQQDKSWDYTPLYA